MRARVQRSGRTYFYFDTGCKPRKEIPLGTDFILALKKYAELHEVAVVTKGALFADVVAKYEKDALPKLAANTRKMYRSDTKHVQAFFSTAPLDEIRPTHIKQFLEKHKDKPTTANRCKRLFSTMWNHARGWGYTDLPNPCEGIKGHSLKKRTVYISDAVFAAVYEHAALPLRDAMDLAYLTGQRPADALRMTKHDIVDGHLIVTQEKTKQPLRIMVTGELAALIERIELRKKSHVIEAAALLVTVHGRPLTAPTLRYQFEEARNLAAASKPQIAKAIEKFWFYDLRAKAADDTSDERGDQAASDLLGHDSVKTTQRHYLRRGKIVAPTK